MATLRWKCVYCGFEKGLFEAYYWKCPICGRPLTIDYSASGEIHPSRSVWRRYQGFLPFLPTKARGEGLTPLIEEKMHSHKLLFKLEYLNPGGSFKDRGTSLAMYYGYVMGFKKAVVDTSGNTGISVTLYSKLYGLEPLVIMPKTAPPGKKKAVIRIGGKVVESANRMEASKVVEEYVRGKDVYYVAHLWNPLYVVGHATIAYEVYEDWGIPDYVVVPVGSGGLLLAIAYGFKKLREYGFAEKVPRIVAVQGYSCQPVHEALYGARVEGEDSTLADGIMVADPPRLGEIVQEVKTTGGEVVLVGNNEIVIALNELWEYGFLVEPTSASVFAAYKKLKSKIPENSTLLLVLTGSGLKTL
ncbi:MAG: pyridoxal-phosphate dependent enzyme [Desulfurococcaceae archaeon]